MSLKHQTSYKYYFLSLFLKYFFLPSNVRLTFAHAAMTAPWFVGSSNEAEYPFHPSFPLL